METKTVIIQNYAHNIVDAAGAISQSASYFVNNEDENAATIKILNVLVESLRSQTVLLQSALDSYNA